MEILVFHALTLFSQLPPDVFYDGEDPRVRKIYGDEGQIRQ